MKFKWILVYDTMGLNVMITTLICNTIAVIRHATMNTPAATRVGILSHVIRMKNDPQITDPVYPAERVTHLTPPRLLVTPPKSSFTYDMMSSMNSRMQKSNVTIFTSIFNTSPQVSQVAEAWENSCRNTATSFIGANIADLHSREVKIAVTPITTNASICDVLQQQNLSL